MNFERASPVNANNANQLTRAAHGGLRSNPMLGAKGRNILAVQVTVREHSLSLQRLKQPSGPKAQLEFQLLRIDGHAKKETREDTSNLESI